MMEDPSSRFIIKEHNNNLEEDLRWKISKRLFWLALQTKRSLN